MKLYIFLILLFHTFSSQAQITNGPSDHFGGNKKQLKDSLKAAQVRAKILPLSAIYLVHSSDSNKRVELEDNVGFSVKYSEVVEDTLYNMKKTEVGGFIKSIDDDFFVMNVTSVTINYLDTADNNYYDYIRTDQYYDGTPGFSRIDLSNETFITRQSGFQMGMEDFAGAALTISSISALLISPLISIRYKEGGFNSNLYFKAAGFSLLGAAITIPLFIYSRERHYLIQPKGTISSCEYWYLEEQ